MKNIFTILFLFLYSNIHSQNIDYNNFDIINAEKQVSSKLNAHRKKNNVEEVLNSKSLYEYVSTTQMKIILDSDYIHHPDLLIHQNNYITMRKISEESESLVGVKTFKWDTDKYSIQLFEIIYFTETKFKKYEELAESCINAFHNSKSGHKYIQLKSYQTKNKKGLFSCKVGITKKGTYVLINFALINR